MNYGAGKCLDSPCNVDENGKNGVNYGVRVSFPWGFFGIAFGFSWLMWLPRVLWTLGLFPFPDLSIALVYIGACGPSAAAFVLTYRETGATGVRRLGKRAFAYKIPLRWLAVILLLPPALAGAALFIDAARSGAAPQMPLLADPLGIVLAFLFVLFLGGPLQEEFGWRGYALERLQSRWSPLASSLILGTVWAFWHLPLFHTTGAQSYLPLWAFILWTNALSVLFTWVYNATGGSLFAAILLHAMTNLSFWLFPLIEMQRGSSQRSFVYLVLLTVVVAGIVGWRWGKGQDRKQEGVAP